MDEIEIAKIVKLLLGNKDITGIQVHHANGTIEVHEKKGDSYES